MGGSFGDRRGYPTAHKGGLSHSTFVPSRDECIDKIRNISKLPTRKIKLPKANGNV